MSEYCLRWNNHRPNLVTVFSELLTSEALVDVTLATDGHYIHAHKLVLSACSVYFKDLFGANPCKHPIVILKDIRIEDLKTVIDFIYRGEVNVAQDRLQDVLRTAESLRIKGLAENPRSYDELSSHSTRFMGSQTSRQRSSMTDSREQSLSVEGEEEGEAATPPPNKKRKMTSSHDSSESVQEEGEGEERGGGGGREVKDEPPDDPEERPSREGSEQDSASMGGSQEGVAGDDATAATTTTTTITTPGTSTTDPSLPAHAQGSVCRWGPEATSLETFLGSPYTPPGPPTPASSPPHATLPSSPISPSSLLQYPMHPPPPAYFPPKGWSPQFRRMSPNMLMAIEAVRSGKMGFTQAGKTFSVNGRTLWVYYRKLGYEVHNTFRGRRNKAPHALPHPQNAPETLPQDTQPPPPTGLQPQPCPGSSQHVQPQHHTLDTTHGLLDTTGQNGAGGTTGNPAPNTTAPENPPLDTVPQLKEESVGITGSLGDVGMGEGPLEQYGYLPPPPPHHHHLHHTPDISNEDLQTEDASRALQSLLESYNFRSMWGSPT